MLEHSTYSQLEMLGKTDSTEKTFGFAFLYKYNKKKLQESRAQHMLY